MLRTQARTSRFQFRIATLLWLTLAVAVVLSTVQILGRQSAFYLTPVGLGIVGYLLGSRIGWPTSVAVSGMLAFALYNLTMPMVECFGSSMGWPGRTLALYESYSSPFWNWLGSPPWFWKLYWVWEISCEMRPVLAFSLLACVSTLPLAFAFIRDRGLQRADAGEVQRGG